MSDNSEFMGVNEVADYLHIKRSTVYQSWPEWTKEGIVNPSRYRGSGRGKLIFKKSEIDELVNRWKIVKS